MALLFASLFLIQKVQNNKAFIPILKRKSLFLHYKILKKSVIMKINDCCKEYMKVNKPA